MTIKVIIAEDLVPILNRYKKILEKDEMIEVVGAVQNGYEAIMQAALTKPDVILMDIEMESRTAGLDATREILKQLPDTKIIILTVFEEDDFVFSAFQLGVSDYLLKNAKPGEIVQSIKDAYHSCSPIRPVIANKIRQEFQRARNTEESLLFFLSLVTSLTATEMEILELLCKGYSRKDICEIRHVEMSTLKTQTHNILKKFDKKTIQEVVVLLNDLNVFEILHNAQLTKK